MYYLNGTPGRTALTESGEWLFFSGYAYLGMHQLPAMQEAYREALDHYSWIYSSARISNTQLDIYSRAEQALSSLTQTNATVLFGNGFMAGRACLDTIPKGSKVLQAPGAHPAIAAGDSFMGSFEAWTSYVLEVLEGGTEPVYLLCDAVYPLTATIVDLSFLHQTTRPVVVVVDDSHGIGLLGAGGEGISGRLPRLPNVEYVITYSLSKAMGIPGGAVSCTSEARATQLRNGPWFGATTPPAPAAISAWLRNEPLYASQRKKLKENIFLMQELLQGNKSVKFHEELPVVLLASHMDERYFAPFQIMISSFAYPDPEGPLLNRAVMSALHEQRDISTLVSAIRSTVN